MAVATELVRPVWINALLEFFMLKYYREHILLAEGVHSAKIGCVAIGNLIWWKLLLHPREQRYYLPLAWTPTDAEIPLHCICFLKHMYCWCCELSQKKSEYRTPTMV